jgi:hypothetical protein
MACRQATRGGLGALLKIENAHEETTHFSPDIAFLDQPFFILFSSRMRICAPFQTWPTFREATITT